MSSYVGSMHTASYQREIQTVDIHFHCSSSTKRDDGFATLNVVVDADAAADDRDAAHLNNFCMHRFVAWKRLGVLL
jgi:hypothetical protein